MYLCLLHAMGNLRETTHSNKGGLVSLYKQARAHVLCICQDQLAVCVAFVF